MGVVVAIDDESPCVVNFFLCIYMRYASCQ